LLSVSSGTENSTLCGQCTGEGDVNLQLKLKNDNDFKNSWSVIEGFVQEEYKQGYGRNVGAETATCSG